MSIVNVFNTSDLGNLRDASVDFVYFTVQNNTPTLVFQDNASTGLIKFATRNSDGMPMYIRSNEDGTYNFLTFANVTNVGFYGVDQSFDTWLNSNVCHMFSEQIITLSNGTFRYAYVTKKPGYTYSLVGYKNFYPTLNQWSAPTITSFKTYMDGLYGYDIKLFQTAADVAWYTSYVENGLRTYALSGINLPIVPTIPPVNNKIYNLSDFTEISPANINVLRFFVSNGTLQLHYQSKNSDGIIKVGKYLDGTFGYILDVGNSTFQYLINKQDNKHTLLSVDHTVCQWMTSNYCNMFSDMNIEVNGVIFNNVFITMKPYFDMAVNTSINKFIGDAETSFFAVPDVTNILPYLTSITDFDVRIYQLNNSAWFSNVVVTAIRDAIITQLVPSQISTNNVSFVTDGSVNLIYTKSLYETSLSYFDGAITRLQQECTEERNLNNALSTDDGFLANSLQQFIDTKTTEITDKVSTIQQLSSDLQSLVADNANKIQANQNLMNVITSQPSVSLSNKIVELRNNVYSSIKFLADNHRFGSNTDIVYVMSKVQL